MKTQATVQDFTQLHSKAAYKTSECFLNGPKGSSPSHAWRCVYAWQIVLLPPFLVWPLLPTHCRCRGQMLRLVTLCDTHTQSAGFPWTRDRSAADAAAYTTHNIHKRQTAIPRRDSKPQSKHANGRGTRLYTAWPSGSVGLFLCQDYWLMLIKPDCIKMKIYTLSKTFITFQVLPVVSSWEYSAVKTVAVKRGYN